MHRNCSSWLWITHGGHRGCMRFHEIHKLFWILFQKAHELGPFFLLAFLLLFFSQFAFPSTLFNNWLCIKLNCSQFDLVWICYWHICPFDIQINQMLPAWIKRHFFENFLQITPTKFGSSTLKQTHFLYNFLLIDHLMLQKVWIFVKNSVLILGMRLLNRHFRIESIAGDMVRKHQRMNLIIVSTNWLIFLIQYCFQTSLSCGYKTSPRHILNLLGCVVCIFDYILRCICCRVWSDTKQSGASCFIVLILVHFCKRRISWARIKTVSLVFFEIIWLRFCGWPSKIKAHFHCLYFFRSLWGSWNVAKFSQRLFNFQILVLSNGIEFNKTVQSSWRLGHGHTFCLLVILLVIYFTLHFLLFVYSFVLRSS